MASSPQRPHKPWEIGPRAFRRGRYWWVDLRYAGGGRCVLRNPRDPGWPNAGERTELQDVAERWKWAYVDLGHRLHRERVLGVSRPRPLAAMIEEYKAARRHLVSASTLRNDQSALGHLLADWGDAPVDEVDPQVTLNRLLASGLGPYTVQTYSAFMSGFWRWLELPYSVELPRWQRDDSRVWTDEEVKEIRKVAKSSPDRLLAIDCGLYMGLRYGEIGGLEWGDVDLPSWTVRVKRQRHGGPLKSRRTRTAVILPGWKHPSGSGVVVQPPKKWMGAVLEAAGLAEHNVGWHSLRHTYARMFLERKPELRLLQSSLGHSSVVTTERIYGHLLPERAAAMSVEAIHGR